MSTALGIACRYAGMTDPSRLLDELLPVRLGEPLRIEGPGGTWVEEP
jgi:hypothetical protein